MQRKAHLLFLPAPRRVRGEFERVLPLIYGVKLTQLAGLGRAHILVWFEWDKNWAKTWGGTTTPPLSAECQIEILQGLRLTLSRGLPLRLLSDILATFLQKNVFFIYIMITIDI